MPETSPAYRDRRIHPCSQRIGRYRISHSASLETLCHSAVFSYVEPETRGWCSYGSGSLPVVAALLGQEDAVAEESEAGAAIHLSFDQFGFRVDALDGAVAVGQGESGDGGVTVLGEAA